MPTNHQAREGERGKLLAALEDLVHEADIEVERYSDVWITGGHSFENKRRQDNARKLRSISADIRNGLTLKQSTEKMEGVSVLLEKIRERVKP